MRRQDRDILISRTSRAYRIPRKAFNPWVQSPVLVECGYTTPSTAYQLIAALTFAVMSFLASALVMSSLAIKQGKNKQAV
jgi:hypothetical protein